MERYLEIKDYRNIGVDKVQKLHINSYMEKGQIGELILVIGQNNTGKSNLLSAFETIKNGYKDSDKPDFVSDSDLKLELDEYSDIDVIDENGQYVEPTRSVYPEVSLVVENELCKRKISHDGDSCATKIIPRRIISLLNSYSCGIKYEADGKYTRNVGKAMMECINHGKPFGKFLLDGIISVINTMRYDDDTTTRETDGIKKECIDAVKNYDSAMSKLGDADESQYEENAFDYDWTGDRDTTSEYYFYGRCEMMTNQELYGCKKESKEFTFHSVPNILRYQEDKISQDKLDCRISNLTESEFYQNLFNILGINIKEVVSVYNKFAKNKVKSTLDIEAKKINKELERLSKQFNDIYCYGKESYTFSIRLDEDMISLYITQNKSALSKDKDVIELPLNLDKQSQGFRWFFDFYFNVMASKSLKPGDIVIMDEPAINLHPSAAVEWRKTIKDFAKKSGITFVIATHNPFLIDNDNLDEIRIVENDGKNAVITNCFHSVSDDDGIMDKTLKALTVPSYILHNPQDLLVFVEGITDYNYLTAFKHKLGVENIVFMPINGVKCADLAERLKSIVHNPVVLVDGDQAGKDAAEKLRKAGIEVFVLSEIDEKFETIESLFASVDKKMIPEKSSDLSSMIKKQIMDVTVDQETLDNFKKVFDNISM